MENLDIRLAVDKSGFTYKLIAEKMGISRVYLSRVMGKELKPNMRKRILEAIEDLQDEEYNDKRI